MLIKYIIGICWEYDLRKSAFVSWVGTEIFLCMFCIPVYTLFPSNPRIVSRQVQKKQFFVLDLYFLLVLKTVRINSPFHS